MKTYTNEEIEKITKWQAKTIITFVVTIFVSVIYQLSAPFIVSAVGVKIASVVTFVLSVVCLIVNLLCVNGLVSALGLSSLYTLLFLIPLVGLFAQAAVIFKSQLCLRQNGRNPKLIWLFIVTLLSLVCLGVYINSAYKQQKQAGNKGQVEVQPGPRVPY